MALAQLAPAVLGIALLAAPATGQLRRVEAVGAVPAGADAAPGVPIRRAALDAALREAVWRVAAELVGGLDSYTEPLLEETLDDKASEFVVRFRIVEDRGERRALLIQDPGITTEYVVLAEADVDVGRLRARLVQAGLVQREAQGPAELVVLVLQDLRSYPAFAAVRERLAADPAVRAVVPQEFVRGEAWLAVETSRSPDELVRRLAADPPQGLEIVPLGVRDGRALVRVNGTPPAAAD